MRTLLIDSDSIQTEEEGAMKTPQKPNMYTPAQ